MCIRDRFCSGIAYVIWAYALREMESAKVGAYLYFEPFVTCLLYTSDAADERSSVDLGGRRIIKKNKHIGNALGYAM